MNNFDSRAQSQPLAADFLTDYHASAHLTDSQDLPSLWPLLSPLQSTPDSLEWRPIPHDLVTTDNLHPEPLPVSSCECFLVALRVVEQMHRCQQDLEVCALDHLMNVTREATTACEDFCACTQCVQPANLLLYIAILQQIAVCYDVLMASRSTVGPQSVQLRIGSFEAQVALDADINRIILSTEIGRAIKIVTELGQTLQTKGIEHSSDESKYQQNLVETLRKDLQASQGRE
jgi:hypothetical protein